MLGRGGRRRSNGGRGRKLRGAYYTALSRQRTGDRMPSRLCSASAAVLVRGEGAFIRDFDSTNGTFINDEPVKGERELKHNDRLKIGPLLFDVVLEGVPAKKPAKVPVASAGGNSDDESVAAMLMSMD